MKERSRTPFKLFNGCSKCGEKDASQFYGTSAWCKRCHKDSVLRGRLAKKGLTPEDEARMAEVQGHCCAICKAHQSAFTRSLHMDHNPLNGKARAMLCPRCNQVLGRVRDDAKLLRAMADYLERHD